jgi:hypothetical protein
MPGCNDLDKVKVCQGKALLKSKLTDKAWKADDGQKFWLVRRAVGNY